MNVYEIGSLKEKLSTNTYPGRGIILGVTPDGKNSVAAYFIMGRSVNSRNRVFVQEPDGIRTEAHDPSLMKDPHLIIYHPVREAGCGLIVTKLTRRIPFGSIWQEGRAGKQRCVPECLRTTVPTGHPAFPVCLPVTVATKCPF